MTTGIRTGGPRGRSSAALTIQTAAIAGLFGLAPLAASSAAAPDDSAAQIDPVSSTAVIELVPVLPTADAADPALPPALAFASAPQDISLGTGTASYYAARFHGRRTASGETFDNRALTAAHRTLPFGSLVRVTNSASGASVVVRINDRGPFTRSRMIDVSRAAAEQLGLIAPGHAMVELALVET